MLLLKQGLYVSIQTVLIVSPLHFLQQGCFLFGLVVNPTPKPLFTHLGLEPTMVEFWLHMHRNKPLLYVDGKQLTWHIKCAFLHFCFTAPDVNQRTWKLPNTLADKTSEDESAENLLPSELLGLPLTGECLHISRPLAHCILYNNWDLGYHSGLFLLPAVF